MLQNTKATQKTYALKTMADYHGKILEADFNGMLLNFGGKEFWTTLTGKFNVYNMLLAYAVAIESGFHEEDVLKAISQLKRVKGRFETLEIRQRNFLRHRLCAYARCAGKYFRFYQRYPHKKRKTDYDFRLRR
jgi:UDP-N-acetylmuramyl tripeptide synthase